MTAVAPKTIHLTRELLEQGGIDRMVGHDVPGLVLLTEAERAASLDALLAARPADARDGAWVFAYGSLIWNPAIDFIERRVARIHGWHRSFCLSTLVGRGTPERPGLVLGLDRGGACTGAAFRIAEAALTTELPLLWRREMLSGSYRPRWVTLRGPDGVPFGHAIAFTIRRDTLFYVGGLTEDEVVTRLATAQGALGSAAEYLFQTCDGLRHLGIKDPHIERLSAHVKTILERSEA